MKQLLRSLHTHKKAIIGVGVLIIFLSTILAAAITAGVLVRSTGVLQQKAVEVERTVRERLVTGLEVISASAQGNLVTEKFNNVEFFLRLRAGSNAINLKDTSMTFSSNGVSETAILSDPFTDPKTTKFTLIDLSNNGSILDLDGDGIVETVSLVENSVETENSLFEALRVDFSKDGNYSIVSLGNDISNASSTYPSYVSISDADITYAGTVVGHAYIKGTVETALTLDDAEVSMYMSELSFTCDFDGLLAETKYCAYAQVGNTDTSIDTGELIIVKYKVNDANAFLPGEEIEAQFIPKEGEILTMNIKVPDIVKTKVKLI